MYMMNQFSTKPLLIKTGNDLAAEFCKRVDQELVGAETVLTGFEWYSKDSLKSKANCARKKVKVKQNKSTSTLHQIQILQKDA